MEKTVGDTIPLYEQVKNEIYTAFKEMNNYTGKLVTETNRSKIRILRYHYVNAFIRFFNHVDDDNKLTKLDKKKKKKLKYYYEYHKKIGSHNCKAITSICREIVHLLGITKIEGKHYNPGDSMKSGNAS